MTDMDDAGDVPDVRNDDVRNEDVRDEDVELAFIREQQRRNLS